MSWVRRFGYISAVLGVVGGAMAGLAQARVISSGAILVLDFWPYTAPYASSENPPNANISEIGDVNEVQIHDEDQCVQVSSGFAVDGGMIAPPSAGVGYISCHIAHLRIEKDTPVLRFTATFDEDVVGVVTDTEGLYDTDTLCNSAIPSGMTYPSSGIDERGLEGANSVTIDLYSARTIRSTIGDQEDTQSHSVFDQFRVFTCCSIGPCAQFTADP